MSKKIMRNPTPEEIANIGKDNKNEVTGFPEQIEEKVEVNNLPLKPDESVFAPKKFKHKLVCTPIYDFEHIDNGHIWIRRMTTVEEGMFYESSAVTDIDFSNTVNQVLNYCIRSNIDVYQLNMAEKTAIFIHVIALTYGEVHTFTLTCPECGNVYNLDINLLKDIKINYMKENFEYPMKITLKTFDFPVVMYLKFPSIADEGAYLDTNQSWLGKMRNLIHSIEGKKPNNEPITELDYDDIVKSLGTVDNKAIKAKLEEFGDLGLNLNNLTAAFCTNKSCDLWKKDQTYALPLQQIFINVFQ